MRMPFYKAGRPEGALFAAVGLLQELRHKRRPAGLVACAQPRARVAVEVFVEENQVAPMGIALEYLGGTVNGTAAVSVAEKNVGEPA